MLHTASKIRHMQSSRMLPSINEPMRSHCEVVIDAQTDFLFYGRERMSTFLHPKDRQEYYAAWQAERADMASACGGQQP